MSEQLLELSLSRLAAMFRSGETTPAELLERLLDRIAATEGAVAAYSHVRGEEAREEAAKATAELAAGAARGPLHGIPVSVKDLIETAGEPTTYGSPLYRGNVPDADATVVRRLREGGAIVFGKTNTHEFALGATTPPTRNPFDLGRIPGGSSGGSAAAVAAGSALVALGSDTGGSIRIPASFCGVVGLKPTYGLVSRSGVFPESWSLDHIGPIARHVEDAAILLTAIAGHDPADPASHQDAAPDFLGGIDGGVEGLRIGVPANHFFDRLDPAVRMVVGAALEHLEGLGAELQEIAFPEPEQLLAVHTAIDLAEIATNHRRVFAEHKAEYLPETRPFVELGFLVAATTYIDALRARPRLLGAVLEAMAGVDVLVVPAQPIVAPPVGATKATVDGVEEDMIGAVCRLLAQFNLTGQPALSLCCGYDGAGLPIGLQIVGRPFADATVLRVADAYQKTTPWLGEAGDHQQVPGVCSKSNKGSVAL